MIAPPFLESLASADLADVINKFLLFCGEAVSEENRIPISDIHMDTTIDAISRVELDREVVLPEHGCEIKLGVPDDGYAEDSFHVPCTASTVHIIHQLHIYLGAVAVVVVLAEAVAYCYC